MTKVCVFAAAALAGALWPISISGCDTWVALPDATADGSVILAKNSDRPPMEAQPLVQMPARRHKPGETVKCTYIEVPQAAETYEHLGSKIWWAFGYEHGMNEHGVAIGNEAVWSKEPYQWGDGLLGMDLVRLGLERGKTAHEALRVITALLEKYGQSGDAEHEGEWGKANYHNSFLIADPKEAWVLETAGRYWVAKRVKHGVYSISNIYSIEREWDEAHPKLVEHAIEMGWTKSAEQFNFARDYGDYWTKGSKDPGSMQIRRNMTLSCLRKDFSRITPESMMAINRSHLEGTIAEPRWGASEPFWATPCMHDTARSGYHSAASVVAHLRADKPPLLRQVYWAGFSNPCSNLFKPFYLHGVKAPVTYASGTSTYSEDSPWWLANRVKLLTDLNHRSLGPAVRAVFDGTERWQRERQQTVEAEALRLLEAGNKDEAARRLQQFVDENVRRADREYRMLNETLPRMLATVGIEYLYRDYVRDWTSKAKVPLPLE
ncbi:MAG: C69 family dipeptidase [Bryobacteraceae bacterium]|nr:C69 family dipeptidase [Bryobacteraceae bacterium]